MNSSPAFFDVKKLRAFNARLHPRACRSTSSWPCGNAGSPSIRRRGSTGESSVSGRSLRSCRCGPSVSVTSQAWSTSSSPNPLNPTKPTGPRRWQAGGRRLLDDVIAGFDRIRRVDGRRVEGRARGDRRRPRVEAGEGAGTDPSRGHRPTGRIPAVRDVCEVLGRDVTLGTVACGSVRVLLERLVGSVALVRSALRWRAI